MNELELITFDGTKKRRSCGGLSYVVTKVNCRDFPGGIVVKNPPANAGGMGSSPGPGRSHIPWSN